ncbi:MAG: carotenoid biosynthesis protein, partial [Caulobacterales bacterium]|nr:carotenoid biosynthesis protein [Caulobacterales bacterium]
MGYFAWTIATILLDKRDVGVRGGEVIVLPVLATFVMVMWDLCMDPARATITGLWDWRNGGAYFGVPFVNFMGWSLCVFTFYFIFALTLRSKDSATPDPMIVSRVFWYLPVAMYASRTVQYAIDMLTEESVQISSRDGHVWWTGDIYQSLFLVSIFTMLFVSFYAAVRISMTADPRAPAAG